MQKLDLRNNLQQIISGLKSRELVTMLDAANVETQKLIQTIVDSKSAYDKATTIESNVNIFKQFQLEHIYSTDFFSHIMSHITRLGTGQKTRVDLLRDNQLTTFYSQQKTLLATFNIVDSLLFEDKDLFDDKGSFNVKKAADNGNLILEVIDDENVSVEKLQRILKHLTDLISSVYLLYDKVEEIKFTEKPTIGLIDSGSDININVKIPEKAANLIAQILKDLWDVIINNKSFRRNQKLKDIENSLSVMGKIEDAKKKEIIDAATAEVLKKGIYENAKEIIFENTLSKEIVIETKKVSNRQLILEQTKIHQLNEAKKDDNDGDIPKNDNSE